MGKILIIGNVLKDVYLRLDDRSNDFETDARGISWLELGFNGAEHTFFRRTSAFGGAAVSLATLHALGIEAAILNSATEVKAGEISWSNDPSGYRYIFCHHDQITYFVPSSRRATDWSMPKGTPEWLLVDRSTTVTPRLVEEIKNFLKFADGTKLAVHMAKDMPPYAQQLADMADLLFLEEEPPMHIEEKIVDKIELDEPHKQLVCHITPRKIMLGEAEESWSLNRIDMMTHLTVYSTIVATVLGVILAGGSAADALLWARLNAENTTLDGALGAEKLQELAKAELTKRADLRLITRSLMTSKRGILAVDSSERGVAKVLQENKIANTPEKRRTYRELLVTTPKLKEYITGVIITPEMAHQKMANQQNFVDYLTSKGIISGIKADRGLAKIEETGETHTLGLEGLHERLVDFYGVGARFVKWRAEFRIAPNQPNYITIRRNVEELASFAKEAQLVGLVPIVEVDILADSEHSLQRSAEVTGRILGELFERLEQRHVDPAGALLKCSMVSAGTDAEPTSSPEEVGVATAAILRNVVPKWLAGILILSGGQDSRTAIKNLAAITQQSPFPWPITFAFGRAFGEPVAMSWKGEEKNLRAAQATLVRHLENAVDALRYLKVESRGSSGKIRVLDL